MVEPISWAWNGAVFLRIRLRENLQETIDFPMKYEAFLQYFPLDQSIESCGIMAISKMISDLMGLMFWFHRQFIDAALAINDESHDNLY